MKIGFNYTRSTPHTEVLCEDHEKWFMDVPHHFEVLEVGTEKTLCQIEFQKGPVNEYGINGVNEEDLLLIVLERLDAFQGTMYNCRENALAKTKIEEALMWLNSRSERRKMAGKEGTSEV